LFTHLVYALSGGGGGGEGGDGGGILGLILPFVIVIAIFYVLIIMPQRKKEKQKQAMLNAVTKGDRIVTIGGLKGTVVGVDDREDSVTIRVSGDVKLEFLKSAIAQVIPKDRPAE
jgi:preprotein translocase subunit YajC